MEVVKRWLCLPDVVKVIQVYWTGLFHLNFMYPLMKSKDKFSTRGVGIIDVSSLDASTWVFKTKKR